VEAGQGGRRSRPTGSIETDSGHDASLKFGGSEARARRSPHRRVRRCPAWKAAVGRGGGMLLLAGERGSAPAGRALGRRSADLQVPQTAAPCSRRIATSTRHRWSSPPRAVSPAHRSARSPTSRLLLLSPQAGDHRDDLVRARLGRPADARLASAAQRADAVGDSDSKPPAPGGGEKRARAGSRVGSARTWPSRCPDARVLDLQTQRLVSEEDETRHAIRTRAVFRDQVCGRSDRRREPVDVPLRSH
jgi:hypothetical protein